jgi:hypothetical protein
MKVRGACGRPSFVSENVEFLHNRVPLGAPVKIVR